MSKVINPGEVIIQVIPYPSAGAPLDILALTNTGRLVVRDGQDGEWSELDLPHNFVVKNSQGAEVSVHADSLQEATAKGLEL